MTYMITQQCIDCRRCESVCPTGAIYPVGDRYQIDADRCTDCVGHYAVPLCWSGCPTNGGCVAVAAIAAPPSTDYWETWFHTYNRLVARLSSKPQTDYWQRWFDTYSQALSNLQTPTPVGASA